MLGISRRVVAFAAPAVLIAAGAGVFAVAAQAGSGSAPCSGGRQTSCSISQQVTMPVKLTVSVGATPAQGQSASVSWTVTCSAPDSSVRSASGSKSGTIPFKANLGVPKTEGASCTVDASVSLSGGGSLNAGLNYQQGNQVMISLPTHDTRPGAPLAYFKCMGVKNDSSRPGAQAVLSPCAAVYADEWFYDGTHLKHRGMCLTDPHNGGSRTKLVLARCGNSADQAWTIRPNGIYNAIVLRAHGGKLCLDDPRYSQANGNQMTVFTCTNGDDQAWAFQ